MVVEGLTVVHADTDQRGTQKENILVALDRHGVSLGALFIYPFFDADLEPEHPHNLYLHLQVERERGAGDPVKDLLLEHALRRAKEIKNEAKQVKTRVYACFLKHQREQIDYFLQRGFTHDEGMYLLDRHESVELPYIEAPESVAVQAWKMETDPERRQFITAHRSVFPRHPYTTGRLLELMSLPGWNNFTAWHGAEIAGNVMLFWKNETTGCIEDLFVQKRWRRRGIARYLLYAALDHFRRAGIHRVQLEMWSANKPALNLYRAFGFSPIDETEIAVGRYV